MNALYLDVFVILGSSIFSNTIVAASVVALGISYRLPVGLSVLQKRWRLPEHAFKLPEWLGWAANVVGLVYTLVVTVLVLLPLQREVSGTTMNYCVAAFGITMIVSALQWIFDGRKTYQGPRVTLEVIDQEIVTGTADFVIEPTKT
jgi:choline transport protein